MILEGSKVKIKEEYHSKFSVDLERPIYVLSVYVAEFEGRGEVELYVIGNDFDSYHYNLAFDYHLEIIE